MALCRSITKYLKHAPIIRHRRYLPPPPGLLKSLLRLVGVFCPVVRGGGGGGGFGGRTGEEVVCTVLGGGHGKGLGPV